MRKFFIGVVAVGILGGVLYLGYLFIGTDAWKARTFNYCTRNKVEMYSGGKKIGTWHTTGKIQSEEHSDGYYFKSEETEGLITVTGDIIVTALKEGQN